MLGAVLSWLNPLNGILSGIEGLWGQYLKAETDQQRLLIGERIHALSAQAAVAGNPIDRIVRLLFALPYVIYIGKLIVWDKIITGGTGNTDPLDAHLWYIGLVIVGFYFVHWTIGQAGKAFNL